MILITRTTRIPDGTFGRMAIQPGMPIFYTMEDDWLDNRPGVSCIPAGVYKLHRTIFHKHGYETFEVMDVPGRSRILIHPANTEEDVEGCIGIGMRMGKLRVARDEDTGVTNVIKTAVVESTAAFHQFMGMMAGVDESELLIEWAAGLP